MADPIPRRAGAGGTADRLRKLEEDVADLKNPSGTQRAGTSGELAATVAYLASLRLYASSGGATSMTRSAEPNDQTVRWYYPTPQHAITLDAPTGRLLVEASCGECSISPNGGFVLGYVSFRIEDANAKVVWSQSTTYSGRFYSGSRLGVGISTGRVAVPINLANFVGPFTVRLALGTWASTTNVGAVGLTFNNPALNVEVIAS